MSSASWLTEVPIPVQTLTTGAAVLAAPTRSLFQTDSAGLRVIAPASWGLRAPGAVAWMSGVTW